MITELQKVAVPLQPGHKPKVHERITRNFRIHKASEELSRLALYGLECDSNNMSGEIKAREVRNFWHGWEAVKREFGRALKYKDAPQGDYEMEYDILFPTMEQIQGMKNSKLKSVMLELFFLHQVMIGVDASNAQTWVGPGSEEDIKEALAVCEEVILETLGTGEKLADSDPLNPAFNVGYRAGDYRILGRVIPDVDGDTARYQEPSWESAPRGVDAPDIDK